MTYEIHGLARIAKDTYMNDEKSQLSVIVKDGVGCVCLGFSGSPFGALLTPAEADIIAAHLLASASRVAKQDRRIAEKTTEVAAP